MILIVIVMCINDSIINVCEILLLICVAIIENILVILMCNDINDINDINILLMCIIINIINISNINVCVCNILLIL